MSQNETAEDAFYLERALRTLVSQIDNDEHCHHPVSELRTGVGMNLARDALHRLDDRETGNAQS